MVPPETFQSFRAELASLRVLVGNMRKKTLRDETTRDRFRTLYRVWISVVTPSVQPLLSNRREFAKLTAEIEALAVLTGRIKPVADYRKRLNRAIQLANDLELHLPPIATPDQAAPPQRAADLFVEGIPDLPEALVPNALFGWRSNIAAFLQVHPFDRSVFIMVRYRKKNDLFIKALKRTLRKCHFYGVMASEHNLTDDLYNPVACLLCCARGLAVFDEPDSGQVFNPNVAYELGMMHLLGRECRILKHRSLPFLLTDIIMKIFMEYSSVKEATALVQTWLGVGA